MNTHKLRVRLYGVLRARFGKEFYLVANTPAEAIQALRRQIKGFEKYFYDHSEPGYNVICGPDLGVEDLGKPSQGTVLKIVPVVAGASAGLRIIAGVALMAVALAIFATSPWHAGTLTPMGIAIFSMGMSMVFGGVAELLTSPPSFNPSALDKGPADTPSYAFQGPHMTTGQGNCVPVGYGRLRVGGAIISAGICPETWPTNGFGGMAPDEVGNRSGDGSASPWVWAVAPIAG